MAAAKERLLERYSPAVRLVLEQCVKNYGKRCGVGAQELFVKVTRGVEKV